MHACTFSRDEAVSDRLAFSLADCAVLTAGISNCGPLRRVTAGIS